MVVPRDVSFGDYPLLLMPPGRITGEMSGFVSLHVLDAEADEMSRDERFERLVCWHEIKVRRCRCASTILRPAAPPL
jgi:hypothetical protein